ncbi:rhodanese-like domain-containing protein [Algoriphagus pacificus]|uniref:Rhodanese-like domain-containing protein n=1 Tax=Algoriphagus pacificus TaxID=2811234 RepID=A0ABS3CHJ6_9BACT|nr:rhodanese-like domain-containing protein [Algoriphagus pacificus]MBN7815626.1 rhodanese-like domain-containing protein [Algoriphagus pacificus]
MKSNNHFGSILSYLFIFVSFFLLSNFSLGQSLAYRTLLNGLYDNKFPVVHPTQIKSLSNYQVLDTREKEEYEVSHLKGAKWVGYDTFNLENLEGLDKEKPVLVYCTVGARSQEIGKKLKENGFKNVYNLYGGIIQWSNDELPLYKDSIPTNEVHTYTKSWGIWLNHGKKVY